MSIAHKIGKNHKSSNFINMFGFFIQTGGILAIIVSLLFSKFNVN